MSRASRSPTSQVGHRGAGRDRLRVADPVLHVAGRVGELARDDRADRDPVERRPDHSARLAHVLEAVAAAAAVLDEHRLAAPRIAATLPRPHAPAVASRSLDGMIARPRQSRGGEDHGRRSPAAVLVRRKAHGRPRCLSQ